MSRGRLLEADSMGASFLSGWSAAHLRLGQTQASSTGKEDGAVRSSEEGGIGMAFPKTLDEMKAAGYKFDNDATCRGCGADIEWWITPRGRKIPMDPMTKGASQAVSHFATCNDSESFRKRDW
jgi:hypothetical protein